MKKNQKKTFLRLILLATLTCSLNARAMVEKCMEKYIVNRVCRELQETVLELNDHMIHDCIKKINFIAQEENLDEKTILQDLHTIISDECAYHKANIGNSKDPRTLSQCKWELGTGALGHALIYTAYRFSKYPAPTHPYPIPETEEGDSVRLEDLRKNSTLYKLILIPLAAGFIVPWIHGCIHLYKYHFVNPKHKERYEKLSKFKEHLEATIASMPLV